MKLVKLIMGILLLPASAGLTMGLWQVGRALTAGGSMGLSPLGWAFAAGYGLWLVVFTLLPKPTRTYVLGHELTHALWAWLMGARVSGLKVRKSGGQVRTSKTNWFITLAPYFFPFYAMLFTGLFLIAHAIFDLGHLMALLFFLVGLGWSFHVTFTLMMLLSTRQPDVHSQGWLFSMVVIYCMNLLTIAVTAVALSPSLDWGPVAATFGHNLLAAYGWTLDKFVAVWQHAGALTQHGRVNQ